MDSSWDRVRVTVVEFGWSGSLHISHWGATASVRSRNRNTVDTVWSVVGNMVGLTDQFTGFRNKFLCDRSGVSASGARGMEGGGGNITPV